MPALLVDTSTTTPRPASSDASSTSERSRRRSESASPSRPPVSPITPTATVAQLAPLKPAEPRQRPPAPPPATFKQQPASVAISESENPDAIALRSAISLLQLQREKSKRDLKALAELKSAAVSDPKHFAQSIQEQQAQAARAPHHALTPTLAGLADLDQDEEPEVKQDRPAPDARKDSANTDVSITKPKLPAVPQPQNIVRCPPVNWAKYHIVGEPLDKLHEEQKKWPGQAEPPRTQTGARAPSHAVAAPYSPFTDGVGKTSTPNPPKNGKKPSH